MLRTTLQRRNQVSAPLWSVLLLTLPGIVIAQSPRLSVSLHAGIVASSRIFIDPYALDPVERNTVTELGAGVHPALRLSYAISPDLRVEASGEYLSNSSERQDYNGTVFRDGYTMYATEVAIQYLLPFTGETFRVLIGGGGGIYTAERRYSIAGIPARNTDHQAALGILTLIGCEYAVSQALSVQAQLRFRDPQVTTRNAFDRPSVLSNGVRYPLEMRPFASKINVNGNVYSVGMSVRF